MSRTYWEYKDGHWQSVPSPAVETKGVWYRRLDSVGMTKTKDGLKQWDETTWHRIRHDGCDNPGRQTTLVPKDELPAELLLALTLLEIEP